MLSCEKGLALPQHKQSIVRAINQLRDNSCEGNNSIRKFWTNRFCSAYQLPLYRSVTLSPLPLLSCR